MPFTRPLTRLFFLAVLATLALVPTTVTAQDAAPTATTCADITATPGTGHAGMDHGTGHAATPDAHAGHTMETETPAFDLAWIDMMIPHHESIIALARVAVNELTDPRLVEIAEIIIATQTAENEEMRQLRSAWYGDAEPVSMAVMMELMPGMGGDMAAMDRQMSAGYQAATFCAAENRDLAFIDLVIPHHEMAIGASEDALERVEHEVLIAIAEEVIAAQQAEIAELEAIRADLTGEATPAS